MAPVDWYIVVGSLLAVLGVGLCVSRRTEEVKDYFLAGRSFGAVLVAISVIATETSAATVIGGPDTSFRGNLAYLQTTIGAVLSRFFLAYFVIETYYKHDVVTVYGFLQKRFGRAVQLFSSYLFLFGRLLASGARLYIASLAIASICNCNFSLAIILTGLVAVIYSVQGGLRAVIWTDLLQGVLFLSIGVYAFYFILSEVGGLAVVTAELSGTNKITFFDFSFNVLSLDFWANPYTFLGAVIGGFTLGLATHGTDQDMVQRMLACRTSEQGKRSLILTGLLEIPVALLFVSLGLVLWVYFKKFGLEVPIGESVFPYFISSVVPEGFKGLFVVAVLAAAMSSLDSALNALSAVTVSDICNSKKKAAFYRNSSLLWGILLIFTALILGWYHQGLIDVESVSREGELLTLALGVMALVYGPLLGIFIIGLFTSWGSDKSVIIGALVGLICLFVIKFSDFFVLGWTWHVVVGVSVTVVVSWITNRVCCE